MARLTINDYAALVLPLLQHCAANSSSKGMRSSHLWYLSGQSFYGFSDTTDFPQSCFCSQAALTVYESLNAKARIGKELKDLTWKEQPKVDAGRKLLHLEHMHTGHEFREDVLRLHNAGKLDASSLAALVREKYSLCWITKDENKRLPKSKRPHGARAAYAAAGIVIVE